MYLNSNKISTGESSKFSVISLSSPHHKNISRQFKDFKGGKFLKKLCAASVGVLQDNLVLSTGLIM